MESSYIWMSLVTINILAISLLCADHSYGKDRKILRLSYLSKGPCELFVEKNIIQSFKQNKLKHSKKELIVLNIQSNLLQEEEFSWTLKDKDNLSNLKYQK